MKRSLLIFTLLLACLLGAGCREKAATPTVNLLSQEAVYTSMMQEMDGFRPDRKPDFCGVIKVIEGKKITITLAEKPTPLKLTPEEQALLQNKGMVVRQRPPLKLTDQTKEFNLASNTTIMSFKKQEGSLLVRKLAIADLKPDQVLMAWVEGEKVVYLQVFPRWGHK